MGIVAFYGRKAPEGHGRTSQWRDLGDFGDREPQAIVAARANRDGDVDRDVQRRDDECEKGGLPTLGFEIEDRRCSEQLVGFPFVARVDGDQPGLGVGRATIQCEIGGGAVGDRVGVAKDPLRRIEDDVAGRFGFSGFGEGE